MKNKWKISKEFIIQKYYKENLSLPELSRRTGIPYETLFYYTKKYGIKTKPASHWHKGQRRSKSTEFKKGTIPWNKGTKGIVKAWNKGKKLSDEYKKRISEATRQAMQRPDIRNRICRTQFPKGTIPWNKGKRGIYSKETLEKIRSARLKQKFPKHDTNAEQALFHILKDLNIDFETHKPIERICQADAYIAPNIVIFADGDYWHCNPKKYERPKTPLR